MVIIESILLIGALTVVAHNIHERQQIAKAQFGVAPPHPHHQKKSWRGIPCIPKCSSDVVRLLRGYTGPPDGPYPRAVLDKYIEYKRSRGTGDDELARKLDVLEKQLAQFAPAFYSVREDYRLRESSALPPSPASRRLSRLSAVSDSLRPSVSLSPGKTGECEIMLGGSRPSDADTGKLSPVSPGSPGAGPSSAAKGRTEIPPPYTADDEVRAHRMEVFNGQAVARVEGTL